MMMMRKRYLDATFLVVLTFLTTFNTENFAAALFEIEKVVVRNSLGPGETMRIHCKSGNVDLGEHSLSNDESFEFSFTISWWTMYRCNLYWDNDRRYEEIHVFDVSRQDHEFCRPKCGWKIKQDGAYCFRDRDTDQGSMKTFYSKSNNIRYLNHSLILPLTSGIKYIIYNKMINEINHLIFTYQVLVIYS
ncbi:hypothetical protein ACOSQ2_021962 [Xanthoceras sorbifolium]